MFSPIFAVLEAAQFNCVVLSYSPEAFGNFLVECSSSTGRVRVTNDRGQVFIDLASVNGIWLDKERLLEALGVSMSRHATIDGLWRGYEPGIQAVELQRFLPELLLKAADGAV